MSHSLIIDRPGGPDVLTGCEDILWNSNRVKHINVDIGTALYTVWAWDTARPILNVTAIYIEGDKICFKGTCYDEDTNVASITLGGSQGTIYSDRTFVAKTNLPSDTSLMTFVLRAQDENGNKTTQKFRLSELSGSAGAVSCSSHSGTSIRTHSDTKTFTTYLNTLNVDTLSSITCKWSFTATDSSSGEFTLYDANNKELWHVSGSGGGASGGNEWTCDMTQYTKDYINGMYLVGIAKSTDSGDTKDDYGHWNTHCSSALTTTYHGFSVVKYPEIYVTDPHVNEDEVLYTMQVGPLTVKGEVVPGTYDIDKVTIGGTEITLDSDNTFEYTFPRVYNGREMIELFEVEDVEGHSYQFGFTLFQAEKTIDYEDTSNDNNWVWVHGAKSENTPLKASAYDRTANDGYISCSAALYRHITPDLKTVKCSTSKVGTIHEAGSSNWYIIRADGVKVSEKQSGIIDLEANNWNNGLYWVYCGISGTYYNHPGVAGVIAASATIEFTGE